jgi:hypothetical protein
VTADKSAPLPPDAHIEDAIIVASLAHATATTPKRRAEAWKRLMQLKARSDEIKRAAA